MKTPDTTAPRLELSEGRATITLSRPAEHNRIDPHDISEIMHQLDVVQNQEGLRVLVLTGLGEKTFSSGYTLGAIHSGLDSGFEDMLNRLENFPLPTICALNGSVYGGACDLAMCCDLRIGVRGMRMFVPAARLGLHYYPGGLRRFVTRLGPAATKKIFLTGLPLADAEILRIGFLQDLVERDTLATVLDTYAEALIAGDGAVISSMKTHIDALAQGDMNESFGRGEYDKTLTSAELARRLLRLRQA